MPTVKITGIVEDEGGSPLNGMNVRLRGRYRPTPSSTDFYTMDTTTNPSGEYEFVITEDDAYDGDASIFYIIAWIENRALDGIGTDKISGGDPSIILSVPFPVSGQTVEAVRDFVCVTAGTLRLTMRDIDSGSILSHANFPWIDNWGGGGAEKLIGDVVYGAGGNVNSNGQIVSVDDPNYPLSGGTASVPAKASRYVPPDSYTLSFAGWPGAIFPTGETITITAGSEATKDIDVQSLSTALFKIKFGGSYAANVTVDMQANDYYGDPLIETGNSGGIQLQNIIAGTYDVKITYLGSVYYRQAEVKTMAYNVPESEIEIEIDPWVVTFVNYDDTVLKTENVFDGKDATAPADPSRVDYTFTGWDTDFTNVTEDLTVTATYIPVGYVFQTPELQTEYFRSAKPTVYFWFSRIQDIPSPAPNLHFRVQVYEDAAMTVLLDEVSSEDADITGARSAWQYERLASLGDRVRQWRRPNMITGVPSSDYLNYNLYLRTQIEIGPRRKVYVRGSVGY